MQVPFQILGRITSSIPARRLSAPNEHYVTASQTTSWIDSAPLPTSFENVVVDLLVAIYGGSGDRVGRVGDGGIDGVVKQDRLGLDHVYVQAKRWAGSVGGDEIRKFAGGLECSTPARVC